MYRLICGFNSNPTKTIFLDSTDNEYFAEYSAENEYSAVHIWQPNHFISVPCNNNHIWRIFWILEYLNHPNEKNSREKSWFEKSYLIRLFSFLAGRAEYLFRPKTVFVGSLEFKCACIVEQLNTVVLICLNFVINKTSKTNQINLHVLSDWCPNYTSHNAHCARTENNKLHKTRSQRMHAVVHCYSEKVTNVEQAFTRQLRKVFHFVIKELIPNF
jgi:hypothetical protein